MLNIAKQIYSGWNTTSLREGLPEAEVIPFGKSSNEKKKLENITRKYTTLQEHDNIPLPGFTLYKTERRYYSSSEQTWLIIDPRGYLVRITSSNLEDILHVTGITEGLIQEKCVWAREDSQTKMILVPISSPKYIEATTNTELLDAKVSIKEVQIGDTVLLQNGLQGEYMGSLSLYGSLDPYSAEQYKPQSYLRRQVLRTEPGKYHYQTDLKILKVISKASEPTTKEQSAAFINKEIASKGTYFSSNPNISATSSYYSSHGVILHASSYAVPKVTMTLVEITKDEAKIEIKNCEKLKDIGVVILENAKGQQYIVDFPYSSYGSVPKAYTDSVDCYKIQTIQPDAEYIVRVKDKSSNSWSYSQQNSKEHHKLDNFVKFYKIVKNVKTESYV